MALDPLTAGIDAVSNIGSALIKHFFPDPTQAAAAEQKLAELKMSGDLAVLTGQLEINKVEASNTNLFVSGWRPFIGWVCGVGLAYHYLIYPILVALFPHIIPLDAGDLIALVGTMLGMGGLRTYEKKQGVA
jgi:hypothetical protein